jgi:hypothetical protein
MAKAKPKAKDKAATATTKADDGGCDTQTLYNNYVKVCQSIGIEPYNDLKQIVTTTGEQIIITGGSSNNKKFLSSGSCRALMNALVGRLEGATMEHFTSLTDLRICSSNISDCGAMAVATFLRGTAEVKKQEVIKPDSDSVPAAQPAGKLQYLDLSDNNIGNQGALHLGRALEVGMNKTVTTLIMDFNALGSEGVAALCKGIATNSSLKVLSLKHCNIDSMGGDPISAMLTFKRLALTTLDLSGNRVGGMGLNGLCKGLERNASLTTFRLADNNIRQSDEDVAALEVFGKVLLTHSRLTEIDLNNNHIGSKGGKVLLPGIKENKIITTFKISEIGMDEDTYKALFRVSNASKGNKGTKSKKKSAKKK